MAITLDDIKILAAERNTDNPDGGGRLTGNVVQSGLENNLFDDVDPLSRVTGRAELRKLGVGVLSDGVEKYMGARLMLAEIPADPKIHALLFEPDFADDTRHDAVTKMASFMSPGGTFTGLLYGNHLNGMSAVVLLQRVNTMPPNVGDVLYLVKNENLSTEFGQFVKVATVASVLRTFTDSQGDFERNQVTLGTTAPLAQDFVGFEAVRQDANIDYIGRTRLRETVVADAAQYYGSSRLAVAANAGDMTVKATSIFEQLLPSSQVETPLLDRNPTPPSNLRIGAAFAVEFTPNPNWSTSTNLQLPGACYPGSLSLQTSGGVVTDVAGKLKLAGDEIGTIDYDLGIATLLTGNLSASSGTYKPAGTVVRAPQASGLEVTLNSRAQNYAIFLAPAPLPGSVSVSYRSGGRWYVLADDSGGGLRGSNAATGAGIVNYASAFMSVTLGALPDIGSQVMVSWGAATQETVWPAQTLKASQTIALPGAASIQPGSVTLSWGIHTATDAANVGILAGSATGRVNYAKREIVFEPNVMPAIGATISIAFTNGTKQVDTFSHPSRNGAGTLPVTASLGAIVAGSLEVEWDTLTDEAVLGAYTLTQLIQMGLSTRVDPTQIARDDGAGNIVLNGANVGTVNYASGAVLFQPDVVVKIPRPNFGVADQMQGGRFRIAFSGISYVDAPSLYPNDASGRVVLRYNAAGGATAGTETQAFSPILNIVPEVRPALLPGSLLLQHGGQVLLSDNGSGKLRRFVNGALVDCGNISYSTATAVLSSWAENIANSFERLSCTSTAGDMLSSDYVFRTAAAPLKPGGFSIRYATAAGGTQIVTAGANGLLSAAGVSGKIDYETGICSLSFGAAVAAAGNESQPWYSASAVVGGQIWRPAAIMASTVRYTAVAYSYLPLSEAILGIDPVRLPQDGRVLIHKKGRVVVVHHTKAQPAQAVVNGTSVNTGRIQLSWVKVFGADKVEITSGYTVNLDTGIVSFTNVSGYSQPVTVKSRIETEALCSDALIDGSVSLLRPMAHNYPAGETLVSSVLLGNTLQAGATQSFSQLAWTDAWSDTPIGNPILAQYDQTTYPIVVNNNGAVTQRWVLIFTSATAFRLIGQTRGQVITGNTATVLAPVNPVTGVAYFTMQPAGWGGGWAAGNVLRFNTRGARLPAWCVRTVEQSAPGSAGQDQCLIEARGAIDA
jgi:hypothetical protein